MLSNQAIKKNKYTRPAYAKNYLQLSDVLLSEESHCEERIIEVPPIEKLRPLNGYNHYGEATSEGVAVEGRVVCSGTPIQYVNPANGQIQGIGIMKHDARPGENVACIVAGDVLLPANFGALIEPAANAKSVYTQAFHTLSTGLFGGSAGPGGEVGLRLSMPKVHPRANSIVGFGGAMWIAVKLNNFGNVSGANYADQAFAGFTPAARFQISISDFVGVDQNIYVDAALNDPNEPILPENVKVEYGGNEYPANKDYTIPVTFDVGVGEGFDVVITKILKDGTEFTSTNSFTVDISASAAPANLATT